MTIIILLHVEYVMCNQVIDRERVFLSTHTRTRTHAPEQTHAHTHMYIVPAASTEYSRDLMVRAADYAREAANVFASIQVNGSRFDSQLV